jgi:hypothetical protein
MATKTKTANETTITPVEPSWNLIFKQLQEDQVKFYLSTQLEPMASIPSDGFRTEWPVDGQRFQDLLISMFYEITGEILKSIERDFMMAQFREECRKGARHLTEQEAAETDQDIIVQAVLFLINSSIKSRASGDTAGSVDTPVQPAFDDRTVVLLQKLRSFQRDGSIPCYQEIPLFTNIFSRKLTRLVPVLRGYGVQVDLSHAEDGSRCKLTRLAAFKFEPNAVLMLPGADGKRVESSGQSSVVKPFTGSQIQHTDGTDGETRFEEPDAKSLLSNPQTNGPTTKATSHATVSGTENPVASTAKKAGGK